MAKGNWKPSVIKPKTRCRICGRVVTKNRMVRIDGIYPAHMPCALLKRKSFTIGEEIHEK